MAINEKRKIELVSDVRAVFNVNSVDLPTRGTGLVGDERSAEHSLRFLGCFFHRSRDAHAALLAGAALLERSFSASARVDLRLHDPYGAIQFRRCGLGVFGPQHRSAVRNRSSEASQQLFCLIFVNVHADRPPVPAKEYMLQRQCRLPPEEPERRRSADEFRSLHDQHSCRSNRKTR